jgi:serine/threonine-protein kinase
MLTEEIDRIQFILPPDIVIVPVDTLAPGLRRQIHHETGDFAISRPRMRRPSKVVGAATAGLLREFRHPATILDAVIQYSSGVCVNAADTLDEAFQALQSLIAGDLLVPAGSPFAAAVSATFTAGMRCGEFEIARLVHALDDTELYEATAATGVRVALKLLRPNSPLEAQQTMSRETAVVKSLRGPFFPRVHSSGSIDGHSFLALHWVDGVPLDTAAARLRCAGPSSLPALQRLCSSLLNAFASLHDSRIVHGDVHPGNVLVRPDGSVCVLDFGRSRITRADGVYEAAPRAGLYPFYEPELAAALLRGEMPPQVTPEGEQYALAALAFSLITGAFYRDFALDSQTLFKQVAEESPLPFIARGVPAWPAVEAALARALQKDPDDRFPSLREFQLALAAAPVPRSHKPASVSIADVDFTSAAFARPDLHCPEPNGVIWFLLRSALLRGDALSLSLADAWAERQSPTSAALAVLRALIADARMDRRGWSLATAAFLAETAKPPTSWDLLGGRAGDLAGAAMLLAVQPHETLESWARETAAQMPFGNQLGGFAHGDAGRAYAAIGAGLRPPILDRLAAAPLPASSSWCRGTAGLVHLWARSGMHDAAGEEAAEHTYRHEDANPSLCCGLAGRAFALHAWHRHTGEAIWLRRARDLCRRACKATHFPGPALSLRRGPLGATLLRLELNAPETAAMPPFLYSADKEA